MKKFGLQLFSVRDHMTTEEDVKEAFIELGKMGYTNAQTAGTYDFIAPEKFAEYACDAGIEICGTHYDWGRIKNDIEGTVAYHKALGTTNVGIGGLPSVARMNEFIDEFNACAVEYAKYGMKLTYHHHSFEFRRLPDGKTVFDHLVERLDKKNISFVLDTYWLQHGGKDIREMIELQNAIEIDNVKNVLILNKTDFKNIIMNPDVYAQIENIWVNQNIVLNSEELKLLEAKGFKYIPREFFGQELREAAE